MKKRRLVLCACFRYLLDPEQCDYVRDGRPLCAADTCAKVAAYREQLGDRYIVREQLGFDPQIELASPEECDKAAG